MKEGQPLVLRPWTPPAVDIEISYDVENLTDPFVYLHGLLVRPTGGRAFWDADFTEVDFGSFEPVCATHRDTEEAVWQRFLAKIEALTNHESFVCTSTHRTSGRCCAGSERPSADRSR